MNEFTCILGVIICGLLSGPIISDYSSKLINCSEDCVKEVEHKLLSVRNVVISVINAFLWLTIYICRQQGLITVLYMIAVSILLIISVIDFAVYEIPPQFNIALGAIGVVVLVTDLAHWYEYLIGGVCVSGLFLLLALATKGKGMGGGDIKLMAAAGLILGWKQILFAMVLGCFIGVIIHGLRMIISKKQSMLAFGPYLSMGIYIMFLFGNSLVEWYINTFIKIQY